MKQTLAILLLAILTKTVCSQKTDSLKPNFIYKNSAQVGLGGHGVFYSLDYERVLLNGPKTKTTGQIGLSYYPPAIGIIALWIPVIINELISFNKHHIELGLGYVITKDAIQETSTVSGEWDGFFAGRLGYRYQKPDGRLLIRVGFTPLLYYPYDYRMYREIPEFIPLGGLAIGYCFSK